MAGKDEKTKRTNFLSRFYRETIGELKKVSWPTWPESRRLTIIVLIVMAGMAIFLFFVDEGVTFLLAKALGV